MKPFAKIIAVGVFFLVLEGHLIASDLHSIKSVDYTQSHNTGNSVPVDETVKIKKGTFLNSLNDIAEKFSNIYKENPKGDIGINKNTLKFGTDKLVRTGDILTWGWLSIDHTDEGEVFVAVIEHHAGVNDTVFFYRSTDGNTWSTWPLVYYPGGDTVFQTELLVGRGINPWIYTFFHAQDAGTPNSGGLVMRRMRADALSWDWIWIVQPGDSIGDFAVDMDSLETLFLAYTKLTSTGSWNVYATMSEDLGLTWSSPVLISAGNRREPEIAIGGDSVFYIVYIVNDTIVRVGRNTKYLSGTWNFTDIETDGDFEFTPSIAASRFQIPDSQTAWIFYRNYHSSTGNYDVHYAYTTDGGASWTWSFWPHTNYAYGNIRYPWVTTSFRYPYDICAVSTVVYTTGDDSVVTAWAYASSPSSWNGREIINDYAPTTEFGPRIDLNISFGGHTIVYREFASDRVWFDYFWNVGISEKDNFDKINSEKIFILPTDKGAVLNITLLQSKMLNLKIYSLNGSLVESFNKHFQKGKSSYKINLEKKGIFFLQINGQKSKMIIVR